MPAETMPDRRITKTRLALREALLSLLTEHDWDELTIQAICERANIGRSTFYLHFDSKDDLLSESLNDLRDALGTTSTKYAEQQLFAFLPGLLAHMRENRQVFRNVIGRRSGYGVERRFREMVFQLIVQGLVRQNIAQDLQPMQARWLAGGIVDLMAWWVDASDAPDMATLEKFILSSIEIHRLPA